MIILQCHVVKYIEEEEDVDLDGDKNLILYCIKFIELLNNVFL